MVMRKAETNRRHRSKRCKATELTIRELRSLLLPYKDDEAADVVLRDEANLQTLKRWYQSLANNFNTNRRTRLASHNAAAIKSIDRSQLKVNDSISGRLCQWDYNPETFWWPAVNKYHVEQGSFGSIDAYRKFFTVSAIHLYNQLSSYKILWRFTAAAVYLHFRRWKPEIQSIRKTHVQDFLRFLRCDATQDATTSCLSIIKAGQRRISFCHLLASYNTSQSRSDDQQCDNDGTNNAANEDERFKTALGIFFYDNIPDSIWDCDDGLFQKDNDTIIRHLHSIEIMTPPKQYDTFRLANRLLDYQSSMFWPNESEKQIPLEQSQTQMTPTEAAGMLNYLATYQPAETIGSHAMQKQPAHELGNQAIASNRAGSFTYSACLDDTNTRFSPNANHTQNADTAGFNGPPFANAIVPFGHRAGFAVDPDCFNGLQNAYPGNCNTIYQAGFHIDPNSFTSLTPQDNYQTTYETPCQTDLPMNPNSFAGLMPPL